jgi:hypothetical protein
MDKINYISEPHDEEYRVPMVTYDEIMSRLTHHLIRQEVSNTIPYTPPNNEKRPLSTSDHITSKLNKKVNSERMPGYVQPYRGKPPMGELNTPVNRQRPVTNNEKIQGLANNTNQNEIENKLLLMRKIALHNSKVISDKNKAVKTQMKFQ